MLYCVWSAQLAEVEDDSIHFDLCAVEVYSCNTSKGQEERQQGSRRYSVTPYLHFGFWDSQKECAVEGLSVKHEEQRRQRSES